MAVQSLVLPARYADPQLIARGGMADIYAAQDTELGRRVAVKVLSERYSEDPDIRERFKREALAAARLSGHPHIATIFDVGEAAGRPFIVMELLEGGNLAERIETGAVSPEQALTWLGQAASALDAAHAEGIVHRDVKPGNLLLDAQDELKITDFGIALVLDEAATAATATGTVLGTAGYLSPEQAAGRRATAESDIYALGVVAYELLAGQRPFARPNATAEAAAHLHEPVRPPSEVAGLPPPADPVFARVLAKDPDYRYGSAAAFVQELSAALGEEDAATAPTALLAAEAAGATEVTEVAPRRRGVWSGRRFVPLAAALLLLAGGGVAAVALTHGQGSSSGGSPGASHPKHHPQPPAPTPVVNPPPPQPHGKAKGHSKSHGHGKGHDKGPFPVTHSVPTAPTTRAGTTTATTTATSPTTTAATTTTTTTTTGP